jgi:myo-inositol-1(or 4)-monophosphatase
VSGTRDLETSIVGLDWSRGKYRRQAIIGVLDGLAHNVHTIRALGSAALALAWVANGRLDIYFNVGVGAWDVAAASVIISEAGGSTTNYTGSRWSVEDTTCVATNGALARDFREVSRIGEWLSSDNR